MKVNKKKVLKAVGITWGASFAIVAGLGVVDIVTDGAISNYEGEEVSAIEESVIEPVYARCEDCGEYTKVCATDCAKCEGEDVEEHNINSFKKCDNCGSYLYDEVTRNHASK